jgi:long-chain acyl-CoA synthetase
MASEAKASPQTLPQWLAADALRFGDRAAMRHKDMGIWQSWTWAEVARIVRNYAAGLQASGVRPGDKVAIAGANRPMLYWAFPAVQSLGAVPVPVYADSVADEMAYVLDNAEASFAIVQDQEQVDKLLSVRDRTPRLKRIFYDEERGLRDYDRARLHSLKETMAQGEAALARGAGEALDALTAKGRASDLAVMLYTSGTTGRPKGVMLSHENLIASAINANRFDSLTESEEVLAYLPLAWVGDHVFSYVQQLVAGYCVCCPESAGTVDFDRREIAPTYFFAPPRVFESMLTAILVRMQDAGRAKKRMFDYFMAHARRVGEAILEGKPVSAKDRLLYRLGEFFVYGPLKNRMGLSRMRVGYTAGEAIGPEIFSFFRSLGLNLKQLYGQTEASVYITAQPDGEIRADTVGKPCPGVEIRIAPSGEVLYRSPGVFLGYFRNAEATAATKTRDGWVHTGDAGFFDGRGHLRIIDRAKDVGKLSDGSLFAPKYIENKLKFFPDIKEAVAFGDGRKFVGVFLNIDLASVGNWAERNNVAYASYQELAAHPQVCAILKQHVEQVNRDLAHEPNMAGAQIRRFLVLHKELDADDGELTRTQKVRRSFIAERYAPLIDAIYDGAKRKHIDTEVVFEDGRKGRISATLNIFDAATFAPAAPFMQAAQ